MNILMLMTDQMHKYALGKVSPFVHTPNLDKLADEGTLFTNAYSNNPVCTPYRGILYSGRYSKDNGVQSNEHYLRPDEVCLPNELGDAGYETSFVGKLHLGATGNGPIAEEYRAGHKHFLGYQCYNHFINEVCFYDEDGKEHRYDEHRTNVTAQLGIERMRKLVETGKPFLHTIFFQAPHYPEQPSVEFEAIYDGVDIPMAEQYSEVDPYTATWSPPAIKPKENCPDYQKYGNNMPQYLKMYYGMVSQIDYQVGKIMDELEKLGIADDTAIIFSADHGDMQGSHGLVNKCLPYERSCGIPLIVKVPNVEQVSVVDTPVSAVDYYPTCMELAGVASKKKLPGESLVALMKGEKNSHIDVFAENHMKNTKWYMLRRENIKLIFDDSTLEVTEVYDLAKDPEESCNVVACADYSNIIADMKNSLTEIMNQQY